MMDVKLAEKLVLMALECVTREYPNKIAHTMLSDADARPPRLLTPAFYGCYDWHSAVHGHWLLARLVRLFPDAPFAQEARGALARNITPENIIAEVHYFTAPGREAFERPYGMAWLLTLARELESGVLDPLAAAVRERFARWIEKLAYPVRSGEHSNTAFALGLAIDASAEGEFRRLLIRRARDFYLKDRDCPCVFEPSGEDFLSPCLAEADLMRRVLPQDEYAEWLGDFLGAFGVYEPVVSPDPADPKFSHLDGLNLSRAWMFEAIIRALPEDDGRLPAMRELARANREAGLAAVSSEHYTGAHWLGTFAVYLLTARFTGPE
jgi:hypothetical protein